MPLLIIHQPTGPNMNPRSFITLLLLSGSTALASQTPESQLARAWISIFERKYQLVIPINDQGKVDVTMLAKAFTTAYFVPWKSHLIGFKITANGNTYYLNDRDPLLRAEFNALTTPTNPLLVEYPYPAH